MRTAHLRSFVDFAVTVILATAAVLVIWRTVVSSGSTNGPRSKEPVEDVRANNLSTSIAGINIKGNASASIAFVEFSDFECPFCEKYSHEVFELIDRNFVETGRLLYAFRHFPLENHPNALAAAEAAECASRQGKFWEMHRLLFARRNDLSQRFWQKDAGQSVGLDSAALARCLDGPALEKVRNDIAEGRPLGINSTPTFAIGVLQPNGRVSVTTMIRGAQSYEVFEKVIKESS